MKLPEKLLALSKREEIILPPYPSCVVPNAALSPSEVMRLYSRGEIRPLANTINESEVDTRNAHTDPLIALSSAQDLAARQLSLPSGSPSGSSGEPVSSGESSPSAAGVAAAGAGETSPA